MNERQRDTTLYSQKPHSPMGWRMQVGGRGKQIDKSLQQNSERDGFCRWPCSQQAMGIRLPRRAHHLHQQGGQRRHERRLEGVAGQVYLGSQAPGTGRVAGRSSARCTISPAPLLCSALPQPGWRHEDGCAPRRPGAQRGWGCPPRET